MPRNDTEFEVEIGDEGLCDVRRDRRAFAYDLDDVDEAMRRIRREIGSGEEVMVIEQDGYRTRRRT